MSSWDSMYSLLVKRVPYKALMVIPPLLSILMVSFLAFNGLEMGLEFKGGTWIEALTDRDLSETQLEELSMALEERGLEDVSTSIGWDVDSGSNKITVTTTSVFTDADKQVVKDVLNEYTGSLWEYDSLKASFTGKPPAGLGEKLNQRLEGRVDVSIGDDMLTVTALNLDEQMVKRVLEYYLGEGLDFTYQQKNFNSKTVGATLGATFRRQGFKAVVAAFILMAVVIFIAFRDLVPSFAVMLAAGCDIILTVGAMSILKIPLEPASLAAVLMLIGYSVDSDILLTVRVLKERRGLVEERINDAIKTGLTMTFTTLGVMFVVYLVSSTLTQIHTLKNIALVLILGLTGDLFTTWFTNAGLLKWYIEEKKGGRR